MTLLSQDETLRLIRRARQEFVDLTGWMIILRLDHIMDTLEVVNNTLIDKWTHEPAENIVTGLIVSCKKTPNTHMKNDGDKCSLNILWSDMAYCESEYFSVSKDLIGFLIKPD